MGYARVTPFVFSVLCNSVWFGVIWCGYEVCMYDVVMCAGKFKYFNVSKITFHSFFRLTTTGNQWITSAQQWLIQHLFWTVLVCKICWGITFTSWRLMKKGKRVTREGRGWGEKRRERKRRKRREGRRAVHWIPEHYYCRLLEWAYRQWGPSGIYPAGCGVLFIQDCTGMGWYVPHLRKKTEWQQQLNDTATMTTLQTTAT